MPAFSLRRLADEGFLGADEAQVLREIRKYNPLLFDVVLKRHLAVDGERLPPAAFETARFFGDHRANRAP
jgi:mannonate dehydratase